MRENGGTFSSMVSRFYETTIERILENKARLESNLTIRRFIHELCFLSFISNT